MGMTVVCQACGARRTLPTSLYDSRVRGKLVNIPCKNCGQSILVDGTVPPPPGTDPDAELPPAIPKQPSLPQVEDSDTPYAPPLVGPAREKTISHVDGPISERGPSARIGRYALFDQFATGGMATVHFGRLDGAGGFSRVVAIKRLLPHLVANREFTDMLLNEARLAARVRHPNVVATLDVVASKGDVLLVLDYVEGEALSTLCRAQAKEKRDLVPIPIAVGIMQDVLERSGGKVRLWPATLYGSLKRLIEKGLIAESGDRPAPELDDARRRYYKLTPLGRQVLDLERQRLKDLVRVLDARRRQAARS